MARRSGLIVLVNAVRAYFAANSVTANVAALGWREYRKLTNAGAGTANRVVFLPSDESGKGGRYLPQARNVGSGNPRPVATVERDLIVAIWAVDASSPTALASDEAQIEAVELLQENTTCAIRAFAHADATFGAFNWVLEPLEHAYGRELRIELKYRGPLFWPTNAVVFPTPAPPTPNLSPDDDDN